MMLSSWMLVDCPACGSRKGSKCRTLTTNRVTDTHTARIENAHAFRENQIRREGFR